MEDLRMSKTIYDVTLLELLPPNLADIPEIIAAGRAIDKQWQKLAARIKEVLTFADIDNASSDVVDMLATEMNVDFYDSTLALAKRRAMVKNGYLYKYRKGTAYAVKQIVTDAYDTAYVEEWFDYNGKPFHFRITTEAGMPDETTINKIFSAVKAVKNVRSTLDYLGAVKKVNEPVYYGFAVYQRHYQKIQ
jgi:phage tail P2-like protein